MISRYSTSEMNEIWSEYSKLRYFLQIERTVNDILIEEDLIPNNKLSGILLDMSQNLSSLDCKKLDYEEEIHHDVNAFIFATEDLAGIPDGRWVHYGLTSSDLLDTTLALQVQQANTIIHQEIQQVVRTLEELADIYQNQPIMARTHGQVAEQDTLGRIFSLWKEQLDIRLPELPGKISGAIGSYNILPMRIETLVLNQLHINQCNSTQTIPREKVGYLVQQITLLGCVIEKIALQIRLYQQSNIDEIQEPFARKQTGSSAMPHKRNPILSENLCGLARVLRGYQSAAMENIALWGHRDISHSSVERIIIPDSYHLIHFMLKRLNDVLQGLSVIVDNIEKHLTYSSQQKLLDLIRSGYSRQAAYYLVQKET